MLKIHSSAIQCKTRRIDVRRRRGNIEGRASDSPGYRPERARPNGCRRRMRAPRDTIGGDDDRSPPFETPGDRRGRIELVALSNG